MSQKIDLTGQRFGKLLVLGLSAKAVPGHTAWNCVCDCGRHTVSLSNNLRRYLSTSCGCQTIESNRRRMLRHGDACKGRITAEHRIWRGIIERCTNPNSTSYKYYGGRGIRICEEWMQFENFLRDMGRKPAPGMSINRIDVNGNYEPGNCRWTTPLEQARNKRKKAA